MKIFAIRDSSLMNDNITGYLFYHENSGRFFAEIPQNADEWVCPFMFAGHVKRGIYSIGSDWTRKWVDQRIVPQDRQNLGMILKTNGLKEYDLYRLLILTEGRCPQDECYIETMDEAYLPDEIRDRQKIKVREIFPISGNRVIVIFRDDIVKLVDVRKLTDGRREFSKVLSDPSIFANAKVTPLGFGAEWGEERWISAEILRKEGVRMPFMGQELLDCFNDRIISTTKASELLGCTRQYINQLDRQGKLKNVREEGNMKFYLRSDVEGL